jgi:anti-sigma regulatory factor (Ser/Thr protein kinase)
MKTGMNGFRTGHGADPEGSSPSEPAFQRTIRNDAADLCRAMESMESFLQENGAEADAIFSARLCLEEIVTNVIKYAHDDRGPHDIHLEIRLAPEHVVIQVADDGRAFNPLESPPPDLDVPFEDRPVGGLGVHLIKNLASRLDYVRAGDKNVLTTFIPRSPKD